MVTISIYGLDQYTVGHYSKEHTKNLANLLEVKEDDLSFYSPDALVFHNGVEQTSWNLLIHVHAPKQSALVQDEVAEYLLNAIGDVAIHKTVVFYYYPEGNRYENINDEYPRYITEENLVDTDVEYDEDIEEGEEDDQIYTGDIFEGLDK